MVREEITGSTRTLQWKCVESIVHNKCLYYGCFILSPLMKEQADTICITMRKALFGEIEGTYITRAKFGIIDYNEIFQPSNAFSKDCSRQEIVASLLRKFMG